MALQNINIGTTANDGTGDDARTWAAKSNANFQYLDNLIGSLASEVENSPYFDMAAMYADQGNQSVGKIQYVLDASAHPDVSTAEARHFEYLGTTVGDHTDYRLLTPGESSDLINPAAYKTFLIEALQDAASPLTTVGNTKISFEYSGVNVTGILFNSVYTDALANFYNTACNIQFYNITTGVLQKASIEAGDWTTVNTDYYRIAITAGAILLADLSVNDRLEFALTQNTSTAPEGTSVLSTGEVGGTKFLREDGDGTCSWQSIPGGGDLLAANNLSDVANAATSRTNLGIDTTANQTDSTDKRFMTDAQEAKIDYLTVTQAVDLDQMETDIAALVNGMVYKGDWDASSGSFPGGGTAEIGWFYNVSVAGTVDSVEFAVGDSIIAKVDNASTTTYSANWVKKDQTDAVQSVAGLVGTISAAGLRTALNVEDGADVTDATNVAAAGAVMNSDTSTAAMSFVINEDNMASDSATKVPTQQSVKAYADTVGKAEYLMFAVSDETTDLAVATGVITFRMPYAMTLTGVRASVVTAPTGSALTVDINEGGTTILSTKLTIDATEKTSTTAATAAVISDTALADDAEITVDIDAIGSTVAGAGLKITLIGSRA